MKRNSIRTYLLVAGSTLLLPILVYGALAFGLKGEANDDSAEKIQQVVNPWERKDVKRPNTSDFPDVSTESWAEETDLEPLNKFLGGRIKLPDHAKAEAAGAPKFWVSQGALDDIDTSDTVPLPALMRTGRQGLIEYPNGLRIAISIFHPQNPTVDYGKINKSANEQLSRIEESEGQKWQLIKVKGFNGEAIDKGRNFVGAAGQDSTDNPQFQQESKAVITWYDHQNWAEYIVWAPYDVGVEELADLVDAMYGPEVPGSTRQSWRAAIGAANKK